MAEGEERQDPSAPPAPSPRVGAGLLALALLAWALSGALRVAGIVEARGLHAEDGAWLALFLAFGALLAAALTAPARWALPLTAAQSLVAVLIPFAGMPRFEGALPAIVAAQLGLVAPPRVAWTWLFAQAVPLFLTIRGLRGLDDALRATAEYIVFSAFAMMLLRLRGRERAQRLELAAINAELLATRKALAEGARLREQTRIRRELHDGLGHALTILSLELDALDRGGGHLDLTFARAALDAARDEARAALSDRAAPPAFSLESGIAALSQATRGVALHVKGPIPDDLPPDSAWVVVRCIQEATTNALKHGRARELRVTFERDEREQRVHIANPGEAPDRPLRPGNGLRGMAQRAASVGGTVDFESEGRFAVVLRLPRAPVHTLDAEPASP